MNLIRYQNHPLITRDLGSLQEEFDQLFDFAFPSYSRFSRGLIGGDFPVDIYQDQNAFYARAEVPGFAKEDLQVEAADGVLTITGHQKTKAQDDKQPSEQPTEERRWVRSLTLSPHIEIDKISAKVEHGVLTVTLPKREEVKPKTVAIQVS